MSLCRAPVASSHKQARWKCQSRLSHALCSSAHMHNADKTHAGHNIHTHTHTHRDAPRPNMHVWMCECADSYLPLAKISTAAHHPSKHTYTVNIHTHTHTSASSRLIGDWRKGYLSRWNTVLFFCQFVWVWVKVSIAEPLLCGRFFSFFFSFFGLYYFWLH